jgi:phosphoribosyl-AMP cyclohydrolase/enamine deaminase RidA (YjgF/YER057c/UK114 family)
MDQQAVNPTTYYSPEEVMAKNSLPDFQRGQGGLLPTVAQDAETGEVLMLAWMNEAAWRETLETGRVVYWSRSRNQLWRKGDTSGHTQSLIEARVDCDGDSILLRVQQVGAACHEGYRSCFFRSIGTDASVNVIAHRLEDVPIHNEEDKVNMLSPEENLLRLGLDLPPAPKPVGVYRPLTIVGNLAFLSGHGPLHRDGHLTLGRIGETLDQGAGYQAARQTGLALLATLRNELGSLDAVKRVVKLLGFVQCTPDFCSQPAVINGCSELFVEVFGPEAGIGARSALGANSLPGGMAVEIEAIFEILESRPSRSR